MKPDHLLDFLTRLGYQLAPEGSDGIAVAPAEQVTDVMRRAIRENKPGLLALLRERPSAGPAPSSEPAEKPPPRRWNLCDSCRTYWRPCCPGCTVANDPHLALVHGRADVVKPRLGEVPTWLQCQACREPYPFSRDPLCRVRDPETGEAVPISPYATTTHCPWCVWQATQARRRGQTGLADRVPGNR
jgi:hypothetical protein